MEGKPKIGLGVCYVSTVMKHCLCFMKEITPQPPGLALRAAITADTFSDYEIDAAVMWASLFNVFSLSSY